MLATAWPFRTTPRPTAAAALSAAPPTTGMPFHFPAISVEPTAFGKSLGSMPTFFRTSCAQRFFARCQVIMPEASLISWASSPVSRYRT
jgi:hypothetical protein